MKIRKNGWLVLNIYVVRELVKGKIPVYNLPLQSEESESLTQDFPFQVKKRSKDTVWGTVDLGNGQLQELVLHRPAGSEGLEEIVSYSMYEITSDVDDPSSEQNMGKQL